MSRLTSDVFRTSFLTMDGTFDPNNSQLFFRPLQAPLNTIDNSFYSLGAAQSNDPSLRINKYSSNGQLDRFGYLYDTQFNPLPPGQSLLLAGGSIPFIIVYFIVTKIDKVLIIFFEITYYLFDINLKKLTTRCI
jgi:hypothetical protein